MAQVDIQETSTEKSYEQPKRLKIRKKKKKQLSNDQWLAIGFITPSIIAILIFVYGFIAWTGYVSFSQWNSIIPNFAWAGLDNYKALFTDFRFQSDIRNTIVFTILFIVIVVLLGQFLAVMIDKKIKAEGLFRNIFLFPMALSFIVTGVVWRWVLNPSSGVNLFFDKLGWD